MCNRTVVEVLLTTPESKGNIVIMDLSENKIPGEEFVNETLAIWLDAVSSCLAKNNTLTCPGSKRR
jgi:hypothetical protein